MNTDIDKKKIKVLCVGGKMQSEKDCMSADGVGVQFFPKSYQDQGGKERGVLESEINKSDVLLIFLGGSGWDWFERLRLPQGIGARKPLVAVLDNYNESFALSLLKFGVEEVLPRSDCTPAKLQFSILSAITRFQKSHQGAIGNSNSEAVVTQEHAAFQALDTLPFGVMFADKDSRVMFVNSAARKACANGSGLYLSKDKRCCAEDPDENSSLHRLISTMSNNPEQEDNRNYTLKISGKDDSDITILVVSVGKQGSKHGVAIFIDSGDGFFNISEETLRSVYGLTQTESELLLRMVHGETLAKIAEARNVTMHTVRAQLKSVFAKTDTNRQASLIKKVLTGPAVLMQR